MNPYFTLDEYQSRLEHARKLMASRGLDALFLTGDRNLYYFSGHQPLGPTQTAVRPTGLILPKEGDPSMVVADAWAGAAEHPVGNSRRRLTVRLIRLLLAHRLTVSFHQVPFSTLRACESSGAGLAEEPPAHLRL